MRKPLCIIVAITLALSATAAAGQSRNKAAIREAHCAKQKTAAEREICLDRGLTRLDASLNEVYQDLRRRLKAPDFAILRSEQLLWLKQRNQCGSSTSCLTTQYEDRLALLEQLLESASSPNVAHTASATCKGEGVIKSIKGDYKTTIVFKNNATTEEDSYKIYWLDYKGRRKLYATIFKGDTHRQSTYLTHPWVVAAQLPGGGEICMGIYMPDPGERTVNFN